MDILKVAVAMSGGVDSSVAAALLTEKYGKENVFGVTMRLFCYAEKSQSPKACCSIESINDAKAVCKTLGIKHYVIDFEKEFEEEVIDNFLTEYEQGHTPNPCVRCNTIMKSKYLMDKVRHFGANFLATGHYARIVDNKLLKGKDFKKDQSYFLYGIMKEELEHTLFPLGDITKEKARSLAKKYDLKTAEKTESQDICFIEGGKYQDFLKARLLRVDTGEIVDKNGEVLGAHTGLINYTIGQRKGLGIASEKPLYVLEIDAKNNQLIVGEEEELYKKYFSVKDLNMFIDELKFKAQVSVRYNMDPSEAEVEIQNNIAKVVFKKPQRSITSGQSAVFYDGDVVLGGGIIS